MEKQVIVDRRPGASAAGIVLLVVVVLLLAWLFFMNGTDRTIVPASPVDTTERANTTPPDGQSNTNAAANAAVPSESSLTAARTSARSAVLSLQGRVGADPAYARTDADLEAVQNSLEAAYVNASGDATVKYAAIKTELSTLREAAQNDASAVTVASFDDLLKLLAA